MYRLLNNVFVMDIQQPECQVLVVNLFISRSEDFQSPVKSGETFSVFSVADLHVGTYTMTTGQTSCAAG